MNTALTMMQVQDIIDRLKAKRLKTPLFNQRDLCHLTEDAFDTGQMKRENIYIHIYIRVFY